MSQATNPAAELPADAVIGLWNLTRSLPSKAREELADYVITYASDCELSPSEFYEALKRELARRKVPDLAVREIHHSEAGFGSAQRLYLRLAREKIYFDVCAAPFGAAFFFSYRAVVKAPLPLWLRILLLVAGIAVGSMFAWLGLNMILFTRFVMMIVPILAMIAFLVGMIRLLQGGAETYYKLDTRAMFLAQTKEAFEQAVEEVTKAKDVKLVWRALHPDDLRRMAKDRP